MAATYKVQAFRKAAATALAVGPEELATRAAAGTLKELPGIGKATEAVIVEALSGRVPAYLATLEADARPPATRGGGGSFPPFGGPHPPLGLSHGGPPLAGVGVDAPPGW